MKATWIALAVAATACTDPPPPEGPQVTSFVEVKEIPLSVNVQIDLLFVIDDSPAMAPLQAKLATDYRRLIEYVAATSYGEPPDLHVGVVTADVADQGRLRRATFLADAPRFAWQRERNYQGLLADAFVDLAAVGASGSTSARPIEAMQRALSAYVNPGFVRDDAYLVVVILAAGDDQGTEPIADAAHALKSMKLDPAKVAVAAGVGCDGAAPRLDALLAQFPNRNARGALCDADLTPLVAATHQLLKAVLGQACFEARLVEPHDCNGWLLDPTTGDQAALPTCDGAGATHCWFLRPSDGQWPCDGKTSPQLAPDVTPFPAWAHLECAVEPGSP